MFMLHVYAKEAYLGLTDLPLNSLCVKISRFPGCSFFPIIRCFMSCLKLLVALVSEALEGEVRALYFPHRCRVSTRSTHSEMF